MIHRCIFRPLAAVAVVRRWPRRLVAWDCLVSAAAGPSVAKLSAAPSGSGPSQPPAASLATAAAPPRRRGRESERCGDPGDERVRGRGEQRGMTQRRRSRGRMERDVK